MKKQFLIMLLALFASVTVAFAQNALTVVPTSIAPNAVDVTCLGADALHPVAGTPYTYTISTYPSRH